MLRLSGWARTLRVVANSIGFIAMLVAALATMSTSPVMSVLFFLAAFDQLEDVYTYTTGRRLVPHWLAPLDALLEFVLFGFAISLLIMSVVYYSYFATWFWRAMIFISLMMAWSSIEDVLDIATGYGGSEKRFVRERAWVGGS